MNKMAWNRCKDPLIGFVNRQKLPLYEDKMTVGKPDASRKAIF